MSLDDIIERYATAQRVEPIHIYKTYICSQEGYTATVNFSTWEVEFDFGAKRKITNAEVNYFVESGYWIPAEPEGLKQ